MLVAEKIALYGSDEDLPRRLMLRAGPTSLELVGGRWGPVYVNGHEVWHGLAFLFRDSSWGTPEPVLEILRHDIEGDGFILSLRGHIACAPPDGTGEPVANATIGLDIQVRGQADGSLHFAAQATPFSDLLTHRCGWVLMHPMSAQGCAVKVQHVDGRVSLSTLPQEVPAWPPFTAVRSLSHEYAPGHWAEVFLLDEDYELEDQRNNADASFKTYSRSNFMPRPYLLKQGQAWTRAMHLRLLGRPPEEKPRATAPFLRWPMTQDAMSVTRLGLAITPDMTHAPDDWLLSTLKQWRPDFLHLTLWSDALQEEVDWQGVQALLLAAGASLRLDLCQSDGLGDGGSADSACRSLAKELARANVVPAFMAALPCGPKAAAFLRQIFPQSAIGGGTPHFFAQLNRLEVSGAEDFMGFTVCPIVHGTDDDAVMKGLQSLPSMLATARQRHRQRDWHVGPSRISARASPLGAQPMSDGQKRLALASCDPRSRGLFGAAWFVGHMAAALKAKVHGLTLPSLVGEDGLFAPVNGAWRMTPAAAMLQVCLPWKTLEEVLWTPETDFSADLQTDAIAAIAGRDDKEKHLLLANLSAQVQKLPWIQGHPRVSCAVLDAASWLQHQESPTMSPWRVWPDGPSDLVLSPYGLMHLHLPLSHGD